MKIHYVQYVLAIQVEVDLSALVEGIWTLVGDQLSSTKELKTFRSTTK